MRCQSGKSQKSAKPPFVCLFEVFGRDCFMQFPDNIHWAAARMAAVICRHFFRTWLFPGALRYIPSILKMLTINLMS
jgi:hypothetical protein